MNGFAAACWRPPSLWARRRRARRRARAIRTPGRKVFKVCKNCHSAKEGKTGTFGPNLYQVVGRVAGAVPGYPYSDSFANAEFAWTPERIDESLADPDGVYPDTKMAFKGLPDAADRADVIAYLIAAGER